MTAPTTENETYRDMAEVSSIDANIIALKERITDSERMLESNRAQLARLVSRREVLVTRVRAYWHPKGNTP
jgi:hypothetical protein